MSEQANIITLLNNRIISGQHLFIASKGVMAGPIDSYVTTSELITVPGGQAGDKVARDYVRSIIRVFFRVTGADPSVLEVFSYSDTSLHQHVFQAGVYQDVNDFFTAKYWHNSRFTNIVIGKSAKPGVPMIYYGSDVKRQSQRLRDYMRTGNLNTHPDPPDDDIAPFDWASIAMPTKELSPWEIWGNPRKRG